MREDEEKRKTINLFMDEENDYAGELEVVHYLYLLREEIGWEALRSKVSNPLEGLNLAPFYGCALLRPKEVAIGGSSPKILESFITAIGATPVKFSAADECCGAYEILVNPEEGMQRSAKVLQSAHRAKADALVLSCPLCEYNLGKKQPDIQAHNEAMSEMPVFYFSQLLAIALGLPAESGRFDLNVGSARKLVEERSDVVAPVAQT